MTFLSKNRNKYFKLHQFIRLAINVVFLFAVWYLFYSFFRDKNFIDYFYEEITYQLTLSQLVVSKIFLNIIGYEVEIYGKTIKIIGSYGVHLDRGCLGRNVIGLFAGFILAYPAKIKSKLWYIPAGISVFFMVNIFRIMALAITDNCCRHQLDFNHHIVFQYLTYGIIIIMWIVWAKFFKKTRKML